MPSTWGSRIAVIAAAGGLALVVPATASATDVVYWACHGPNGQALGSAPFDRAMTTPTVPYGGGCSTDAATIAGGGLRAQAAPLRLEVPANVELTDVRIARRTTGLTAAGGTAQYFARTTADIESKTQDVDGDVTLDAAGTVLTLGLRCTDDACPADAALDVQRVGLHVWDRFEPRAVVDGFTDTMTGQVFLRVQAWDDGVGLNYADLYIDDRLVNSINFGDISCNDLTPGSGGMDLPLGALCPQAGFIPMPVNTTAFPDGPHRLSLVVHDVAGNVTVPLSKAPVTFANNRSGASRTSATMLISSDLVVVPDAPEPALPGDGGSGPRAGAPGPRCDAPRLTMRLDQRPLRRSRGVAVLRSGKPYRFRGLLTCVVGGRRVAAPTGARVDVLSTIGAKTSSVGGTSVRIRGDISLLLSYKTSRTLVFRYTNPGGRRAETKIKIRVAEKA